MLYRACYSVKFRNTGGAALSPEGQAVFDANNSNWRGRAVH